MHVDPRDDRGLKVLRHRGAYDADAIAAWRRLCRVVRPTIVIDVGANYGEVLFSTDYPDARRIIAVEPNPRVVPYLARSAAEAAMGVEIWTFALSEERSTTTFSQSLLHSGKSSLHRPAEDERVKQIPVATRCLDEVLEVQPEDRVAIKMDVEGHEMAVVRGSQRTIEKAAGTWLLAENSFSPTEIEDLSDRFEALAIERGTGRAVVNEGFQTSSKDVFLVPNEWAECDSLCA
jgi:FkbM family methyltransferase